MKEQDYIDATNWRTVRIMLHAATMLSHSKEIRANEHMLMCEVLARWEQALARKVAR